MDRPPHGVRSYICFMKTWLDGRTILREKVPWPTPIDLNMFVRDIQQNPPSAGYPGTAVFLAGNPQGVPGALLHNLKAQ
jgi:KUP system potassium uptake protein